MKHRNRHGRPGDDNVHENVSASTTNSTGEVSPANSVNTGVVRTPSPVVSDDDSSPSPVDTEIVPPHVPAESDDTLPDVLAAAKTGDVSVLEQIFTKAQKEGYKLGDVIICCDALAPLRQTDEYDRTALYIAIMNDQTAFVNYWLEHFPERSQNYKELDFNIPDTWCCAASLNDTEALRKLLARNDAQQYINWINDGDFGLLNRVFSTGNFETALLLMQNGIRYSMKSLCSLDIYGTNTITFIQTLAFLHEQHFNFDFTTSIWRDGRYSTAAYWALYTSLNKPNVFRYYIEQLNVLSCMPNRDRTELRKDLTAHINDFYVDQASAAQELLNYFNQKCSEQPNAPIAQPDATAAGASTQPGAPNAQPGTMAAGEGSGSETTTEGTPPNQGHTTGSSDAQPSRPLTREEMREQRLAALARRRNNNTPNPQ